MSFVNIAFSALGSGVFADALPIPASTCMPNCVEIDNSTDKDLIIQLAKDPASMSDTEFSQQIYVKANTIKPILCKPLGIRVKHAGVAPTTGTLTINAWKD